MRRIAIKDVRQAIKDDKDFVGFEEHPDIGSGRIGLAVMEGQVLHKGHLRLLTAMAGDCDTAIVALGSANKRRVHGHPFTVEERRTMIEAVYGRLFSIIELRDIDATESSDWMDYVLNRVEHNNLPAPTDCYVGSDIEAKWYQDHFSQDKRRLHIIDRTAVSMPSGRELRTLIEFRDDSWRQHVPARIWEFIEMNYPPEMRQPVVASDLPEPDLYPTGTRLKLMKGDRKDQILELKDDQVWRPLKTSDEKADYARKNGPKLG